MRQWVKRCVCSLLVLFGVFNSAFASDLMVVDVQEKFVLLSNGNLYYDDSYIRYADGSKVYISAQGIKSVNDYFMLTLDGEIYFHGESKPALTNVKDVSKTKSFSKYIEYANTINNDGNLYRVVFSSGSISKTVMLKENIGEVKVLEANYALTANGELYAFQMDGNYNIRCIFIDSNVKEVYDDTTLKSLYYIKNDNSLYRVNDFETTLYKVSEAKDLNTSDKLLDNVRFFKKCNIGDDFYYAITFDGTYYKWGNNQSGQIYSEIVDGYDLADDYVSKPYKITDGVIISTNDAVYKTNGELRAKFDDYIMANNVVEYIPPYYVTSDDSLYVITPVNMTKAIKSKFILDNYKNVKFDEFDYGNLITKDGTGISNYYNVPEGFAKVIKPREFYASSDWATAELTEAKGLSLLNSVLHRNFISDIQRFEFCQLIVDACEKYLGKELPMDASMPFADLNNEHSFGSGPFGKYHDSYRESIAKAYAAGIVNGVTKETFDPNKTITREQMASMMYRAAKYLNNTLDFGKGETFADFESVESWAVEGVDAMSGLGIIKGSNGSFLPKDHASIEQAAIMILRLYNKLNQ